MSDVTPPPPPPLQPLYPRLHFTDMRALMIIMGIIIMLGGLACGCGNGPAMDLTPMLLMMASQPEGLSHTAVVASVCFAIFYLVSAVTMVWLGIGSLLIHKWARALLYAMGWFQAAVTVGGLICAIPILAAVMNFTNSMAPTTAPGGTGGAGMILQLGGFMGMLIGMQIATRLLPAAVMIIVYGLRGVRMTTEYFDRQPRWTDGLSVELLCWWIFLIWAGVLFLLLGPVYAVAGHELDFPLNPVLSGTFLAFCGLAMLVSAFGTARRASWAWLTGLCAILTPLLVIIVTLASFNIADYVRERFPTTDPEGAKSMNELLRFLESAQTFWMPFVLAAAILVSFLVWIKPHFEKDWVRGKKPAFEEN